MEETRRVAILASLFLMIPFILVTLRFWNRLSDEEPEFGHRQFVQWMVKGMFLPILVWMLLNSGWIPGWPPLLHSVAFAAPGAAMTKAKAIAFLHITFLIGSYWTVASLAWIAGTAAQKISAEDRADMLVQGGIWGFFCFPCAAWIGYVGGWNGAGLALILCLLPVAHALLPGARWRPPEPAYSVAEGKIKMGKYQEAELEVIQQLEKKEDDFQGWLMLAEIYAVHYHDMASADATIRELCAQPNVNISNYADALHKLADWHLRIGQDPAEARLALECICARLPGTHLERMARQRIAQLPRSREELIKNSQGRTIALPHAAQRDGTGADAAKEPDMNRERAAKMATQLVEELKRNPNNAEAREQFARVLAERLSKPHAALEQLQLLLDMDAFSEDHRARWLLLSATWHLGYTRNFDEAKRTLELLLSQYPQSRSAFEAQRRLNLLTMEMRFRKARQALLKY